MRNKKTRRNQKKTRYTKPLPKKLDDYVKNLILYFEALFRYKLSNEEKSELKAKINQEIYKTKNNTKKHRR